MTNNPTVERTGEASKPQKIDESTMRVLRGKYFTVRHHPIEACGHKIDMLNEPSIGCELCWWTWFSSHGELIQTTDKAFHEQGREFIIRMRGRRYLKYFLRYMATLAKFKKEQEEQNAANTESTEPSCGPMDSEQSVMHEGEQE